MEAMERTTVAVIGLGYIGLPTAAVLATHGADVIGVDVNDKIVEAVNRGEVPLVEPDLSTSVAGAVKQGRLRAESKTPEADVYIVAVPTPFAEGYAPDLSYIDAATDGLAGQLRGDVLVILESTSPPGTTQHMADRILARRPDLSLDGSLGRPRIHVAHCPERVLPGRIMIELVTNDRIVGGLTRMAAEKAKVVYETFCKGEIMLTDAITAEMAKLVENSYRDVNIAFANELSIISTKLGIDVIELIELANHHPRVNILQPGPGVGGHCIAVDPWFIVSAAPEEARLIRMAREVNDSQPEHVIGRVVAMASRFKEPRIAALGLAFKPDIDDLRESPACLIVERLAQELPGAQIAAVEPNVTSLPRELSRFDNVVLTDFEEGVLAADIVVLLVDHAMFKAADKRRLGLREKVVIDTRGAWRWR
jgi:UDP-N-acetyl-D-mannosaminuronic acid dehydrogenase